MFTGQKANQLASLPNLIHNTNTTSPSPISESCLACFLTDCFLLENKCSVSLSLRINKVMRIDLGESGRSIMYVGRKRVFATHV